MTPTEKVRFKLLNKFTKFRLIVLPSDCWIIEGANIRRYSSVRFMGDTYKLHILSAILFNNHDVELKVCHKCDIEACCNPSHIYTGTAQDNSNDQKYRRNNKIPKGKVINRVETPIPEGFELDFLPTTLQ